METIVGNIKISNIKRCYVENATIEVACPKCKEIHVHDFDQQYLSHPEIGQDDTAYFYCENCNEEWTIPMKVTKAQVTIEYDPTKILEE